MRARLIVTIGKIAFSRSITVEGTGLWIQFWNESLIFRRADLLTGLSHICGRVVNLIQFPFLVMLKISPMPLVPVKIPLAMIRIQILLVLLLQFNSSPCLLPVGQSAHPREMIPTKLLHGPELIWTVQSLPVAVRIPVSNLTQGKSIHKHGCDERVHNMLRACNSTQSANIWT